MWTIAVLLFIAAALVARIKRVDREHRKIVREFESVADSVYVGTTPRPEISFRSMYGFPHLQVTFVTDEDLERASRLGQSELFLDAVRLRFQNTGSKSNPFSASRGTWFTSIKKPAALDEQAKKSIETFAAMDEQARKDNQP